MKTLRLILALCLALTVAIGTAQTQPVAARAHIIVCLGDSLTDPQQNQGLPAYAQWTAVLEKRFAAMGASVSVANLAHAGTKTGGASAQNMLARMMPFLPQTAPPYNPPYPDIAVIYSGTNDTQAVTSVTWAANVCTCNGSTNLAAYGVGDVVFISGTSSSSVNGWQTIATVGASSFTFTLSGSGTVTTTSAFCSLDTSTFIQGAVRFCEFGADGVVTSQTSLPTDGFDGETKIVLYDTDSAGGRTVPTGAYNGLTQITGAITNNTYGNSEPTAWQYRSGQAGSTGWARVARASTKPTFIQKILVIEQHYMNWSANQGDTQSTQFYLSSNLVPHTIRSNEVTAVTNEGVAWVVLGNAFSYFSALIAGAYETQGSFSWHRADTDPHFSGLGHSYMADCIIQAITNAGWLAPLKIATSSSGS